MKLHATFIALGVSYATAFAQADSLQQPRPLPPGQRPAIQPTKFEPADVERVTANWKQKPRQVALEMTQKYGPPQELTDQRLVWHNNGPWKRTELINEEIDHNFPIPHKDMLEQVIEYSVPPDKFDELAEYDGSVIVERTRGEISARCDKEMANFLAINLAHDIVTGKKSVEEARRAYAEAIIQKKHPEYKEGFVFDVPERNQGFADHPYRKLDAVGAPGQASEVGGGKQKQGEKP